jgi:replicative superfamily II helicase
MGRAGRPGLDSHGVAVIMTSIEDHTYFNSTTAMDVVESTLPLHLIEIISAEIAQNVISDIQDALLWLKKTYFYVRVRKNKILYGYENANDEAQLEALLTTTCVKVIQQLAEAAIVGMSLSIFQSTILCIIIHYVYPIIMNCIECHTIYAYIHTVGKYTNVTSIEYDADTCAVSPNTEALLMSRYSTKFNTMAAIMQLASDTDVEKLLKAVLHIQ